VALALYFVPSTPAFGNDLLMQYAFVFFLGIWCGDNYLLFHRLTRRFGLLLLGLFVIALPVAVTWHVPKLAMGLLAILGVTWLAELPAVKDNSLIQMFATYTFAIYLMNTLCIGLTKAVLLHVVPWSNTGFLVLGPCLLLAGMFLPILIRRYVISRSRVLSYIIA
jgi:membrane-bound acyltransferase YfiQ involved in biofilm formation